MGINDIVNRSKKIHGISDEEVDSLKIRLHSKSKKISSEDKAMAMKIVASEMQARIEIFHASHDSDMANIKDCDVCAQHQDDILFGSGIAQ